VAGAGVTSWVLVSGDFTPLGGMDRANHALAAHLAADRGDAVHLVAHRAWPDLALLPTVTVHQVWRPFGSHRLGKPLLAAGGRRQARALAARGARVVVNGGNCVWPDVNWVHYVHAACDPAVAGGGPRGNGARPSRTHARDLADERRALGEARLVICNSRRTRDDVVTRVGVEPARAYVVYYGVDAGRFAPLDAAAKTSAKRSLGFAADRPAALFVGALGDRRKGFDTLFDAWQLLCRDRAWDCDLHVAGAGRELEAWRARATNVGLEERVRFLGFREDVPALVAAADVLVHPARYEAYGLAVHEALCAGVPAMVSAAAGVAERYPDELCPLLIDDPDAAPALADRLRAWRRDLEGWRARTAALAVSLGRRSWRQMAAEIVTLAERAA
jgi:glycosyltransferase involved in cell wall biosynthesis